MDATRGVCGGHNNSNEGNMKSYNGFTATQRYKALSYHKAQIKSGAKPASPKQCDSCGQTQGLLVWHSEDYSEPFGPHIGEHGLCYVCHMWIHCRFHNRKGWDEHVRKILYGDGPQPMSTPNWALFKRNHLLNWKDAVYLPTAGKGTGFIIHLK